MTNKTYIAQRGDYRIEFNGSKTYLILDIFDDCLGCYATERRAINALNKIAYWSGQ